MKNHTISVTVGHWFPMDFDDIIVLSNDRKDSDDPIVKERDQAPKIEL
jgi:hypothetical protein